MINDLEKLIGLCKGSIKIEINPHRDYYESIKKYLQGNFDNYEEIVDLENDIYKEIINKNILIELRIYPYTPVGFCTFYHYDFNEVIKLGLKYFDEQTTV